jgi:hypothetical protein
MEARSTAGPLGSATVRGAVCGGRPEAKSHPGDRRFDTDGSVHSGLEEPELRLRLIPCPLRQANIELRSGSRQTRRDSDLAVLS